ncbi:serine carboxypeptidase-like 42 [Beta vulgaris subsp. vulgaris]|uniref:serine carboxypeptidase-like 42 n=1 Tax=Beta vulgaris subsp. vulgaris TaxID=3555 RepID=UPI002036A4A9|nr:serine carboxypeptidase-like 42 [Beta vulgaris subsp. vulgaris]
MGAASNLLFVESPAGVGWSYSNTTSDYNAWDISTGHYIPQSAVALLDHNANSSAFKFNIKGVAIGNPLLKLDRDIQAEYEFLWSHGMISDEIGLTIIKECNFNDYSFGNPDNNWRSRFCSSTAGSLGSRTMIHELARDLNLKVTVPYGAWFHKEQVGGWSIEYGNLLTFATVRGAAHMVLYSQPARALHLFSYFVRGQRLPNATRLPTDH